MPSTNELISPLGLRPLSQPAPVYESLESKLQQFTRDRFRSLLDRPSSTKRLPGSGAYRQSGVAPASEVITAPRATPDISLRDYVPQAWPIMEPGREFVSNWHIDAICDHLEAVSRGDIKRLIINVPPRHMKPVSVDSIILMADGSRKKLGDIEISDEVITHTGGSARVLKIHDQGQLDSIRIETRSGRVVVAAPDHPFLTPSGWVEAGNLEPGDTLGNVTQPNIKYNPNFDRPLEEARLIGYFIGKGSTSGDNTSITCFDPIMREDVFHCLDMLGFKGKYYEYKYRSGKPSCRISASGGVRDWLREIGLAEQTSWTKTVPDFIFNSFNEYICHFLGAYFACNGTTTLKSKERRYLYISFNSVNLSLLSQIQHLLLRVGIQARIRKHHVKYNQFKNKKGPHISYVLAVTSQNDGVKFVDEVPLYSQKAQKIFKLGVKRTEFDQNILPDPIVSMEHIPDVSCRCITLDRDNSFTADDLIVHNSSLVSVCWPTWVWTFMPEHAWLYSSNSHGVATRDSLSSRRLIQSPWYQERWGFRFKLTSDQNAKQRYENDRGGHRLITSIGSSLLGEGGDTLVCDDINGPDESIDGRQSIADWFDHTWSTRKNDPLNSSMVIIQQRLDMADITGHVLAEGGWVHLCLPARYEKARHCVTVPLRPGEPAWSDPRTEEGELLWPQRWTQELVDQEEKVLKWDFPGQQQQRPAARGGIIFMRQQFKFWHPRGVEAPPVAAETEDGSTVYIESEELPREFHEAIQSWDLSFKDVKSSSYVVGGLWLRHFKTFYLRDMTREHMGFTATLKAIVEFSHKWPMAQRKLIEDKANGPAIMDALKGKLNGVIPVEPDGTKEARAFAVTHLVEGGDVFLPHPVVFPWVNTFLEEVCTFPNGVHDDQVDMFTQALRYFSAPNMLETMRILGL